MTPSAIRAHGLRKRYGDLEALAGFDLEVEAGAIHGLLGPNGAGKSTAVGVLTTLRRADEGTATVAGFDVRTDGDDVRRRIGLVGQAPAVDETLGGRQNLVLFARLAGLSSSAARARASELLERFGLEEAADRAASTYSGGMRRRLDIAVALTLEPAVLFLDEPTTGLDPRGRSEVWRAVAEIAARGTSVLLTTQLLDEADRLAHRVSVLHRGAIIAEGSPLELKRRVGGARVVVRPRDPHDIEAVVATMSAALGQQAIVDDEHGHVIAPAIDGASATISTLRALDARGIDVDDLELRQPSLDDAFLALTEEVAS